MWILSLITNNKKISSLIGISAVLVGLWFGWNKVENSIYEDGYNAAVQEYQQKLVEQQNDYTQELNEKLKQSRKNFEKQQEEEIARLKKEYEVSDKVEQDVKYVKEKVFIEPECNTVPTDYNRMLNDSIRSINGSTEG